MRIDLGRVLATLPGLVWVTSPDGRITFANRQWTEFTGLRLTEARGSEWWAVVHSDDLPDWIDRWQAVSASETPWEIDVRVRRFDGSHRRFRIQGSPMFDDAGLLEGWCSVGMDVEDFGHAAAVRDEQGFDVRAIVDSIPIPVLLTTPKGEITRLNHVGLDNFGKSLREPKSWINPDVLHPDDLARASATQADALRNGTTYSIESRHRRGDGVYQWFNLVGLPLRDREGRILSWLNLLVDIDDRKRIEESQRQFELRSRMVLDHIETFVSLLDANGRPEFINRTILDYTGKTEAELRAWGGTDLVHPEDLSVASATFKEGITTGEPFDILYRMRRFDGVYRWFHGRHRPLVTADGEISQWCVWVNDVDDLKRTEHSLRAKEKNLQIIIDTIPALIWSAHPDGAAEFFNQHYLNYTGMTTLEAQGWGWTGAVHPDDAAALLSAWQGLITHGTGGEVEARLRRANGEYRWFLFRVHPLQDSDGHIIKWYGLNTDIDDRKHAEEALKRSEAFLKEGQHLARMGNFSWTVGTADLVWSEPLYRIFGFEPETVVTLDLIARRIHPEDMPLMVDLLERAQRGEGDLEYQYRIVLPDHTIKHLHLIAHRSEGAPNPGEYLGAVLDITQRRLSEEVLENTRSALTQVSRTISLGVMAASIAHEVNQPLSGIVTNAGTCLRMLSATPPNLDGARATARRTIRDGNRAADVISRLRALFTSVRPVENVDLNDAVREVISLCWNDLQQARVRLRAELDSSLPLLPGDRVQLQQVVMNLLRNAADAMSDIDDRARRLVIATKPEGETAVRLSVRDSGRGLSQEDTYRLFEAFYTTKSNGMGIGLSVSRTIIESHGGRLWAEANDGPGATFSFVIPVLPGGQLPEPLPGVVEARPAGVP